MNQARQLLLLGGILVGGACAWMVLGAGGGCHGSGSGREDVIDPVAGPGTDQRLSEEFTSDPVEQPISSRSVATSPGLVDEGPSIANALPWDPKERLYVDKITRESDPAEYERAIREVAQGVMLRNMEHVSDNRAATFAGFQSWESMQARLEELQAEDPVGHVLLSQLVDGAMSVSGRVDSCALQAWEDPFHLEVHDPEDGGHDRALWLSQRETGEKGLYRFVYSTRVGDRQFDLHFDSVFFPGLEEELKTLDQTKATYLAHVQGQ